MSIQTIKNNIKELLDELVVSEVLGAVTVSDLRTDPLNADTNTYPHAYLMPPAIESEVSDNRTNLRTYTFDVVVLFNAQNITGTSEVEEAVESILNKFDNDPTLGGSAQGGMLPVSSSPEPFQHNSKQLIMVVVGIQAKEDVSLSFE
jgi:hypothetical protein